MIPFWQSFGKPIRWVLATFIVLIGLCESGFAETRKEFVKNELKKSTDFLNAELKAQRFEKMKHSHFAFFRATAGLYYKDLGSGTIKIPEEWKKSKKVETWIQGDLHLQNLGFFDRNGNAVFGLNDYDEALKGPFYWDLIRFISSLYLASDELGFSPTDSEIDELALKFLQAYQETLKEVQDGNKERELRLEGKELKGFIKKRAKKLEKKRDLSDLLDKWTKVEANKRVFDLSNPKLGEASAATVRTLKKSWDDYLRSLTSSATKKKKLETIKAVARRLNSGLGSLGVEKLYVLVEGPTSRLDDDLILEVKEQRPSAVLKASSVASVGLTGRLRGLGDDTPADNPFKNEASRSLLAQELMTRDKDFALGILQIGKKSFVVRRISPLKYGYDAVDFEKKSELESFVEHAGRATALAHSRADKSSPRSDIKHSFEKHAIEAIKQWKKAKTTMRALGAKYAETVKADYKIFKELLEAGELGER